MRSDVADSSRETVRMKEGLSRGVGSRESQREGVDERREASARAGWKGGFWWSEDFCEQGQGDQERWIGIEVGCGERV